MPLLNRSRIRGWLEVHNKSIPWLADECLLVDPDDPIDHDVMRNAVNGYDPMRVGRIRLIERVTEKHGDKIPFEHLTVSSEDEEKKDGVKEEKTHPDKRENGKGGRGPKRETGAAA